jgi:hypothetical protein
MSFSVSRYHGPSDPFVGGYRVPSSPIASSHEPLSAGSNKAVAAVATSVFSEPLPMQSMHKLQGSCVEIPPQSQSLADPESCLRTTSPIGSQVSSTASTVEGSPVGSSSRRGSSLSTNSGLADVVNGFDMAPIHDSPATDGVLVAPKGPPLVKLPQAASSQIRDMKLPQGACLTLQLADGTAFRFTGLQSGGSRP